MTCLERFSTKPMGPDMIRLETPIADVALIAAQFDELTADTAPMFKRSVMRLIEDGHSRIVLDLRQVHGVDSTGIGALVGLLKRIGLRGEMVLCGLSDKVAAAFRLTHMDKIFSIHADSAAALRALAD
jgi:anti-sigma B factor antagonist